MQKKTGFTLIELLIVVAIVAVLAAAVIIVVGPGARLEETREASRETHMGAIANALYLSVVDCEEAEADHCGTVALTLTECIAAATWNPQFTATDCGVTISAPKDPLSGNDYRIKPTLTNDRIEIWADSTESQWACTWASTQCTGATSKLY